MSVVITWQVLTVLWIEGAEIKALRWCASVKERVPTMIFMTAIRRVKSSHKTVLCPGCLLGGSPVHGMETSTHSTVNRHRFVR
jgi:hypothetical protein